MTLVHYTKNTMGLEEVFFNYEGVLLLGQMQLSLSVDS